MQAAARAGAGKAAPARSGRKVRLDVHGREKPAARGWIHALFSPAAAAACIVAICLAPTKGLKAACSVYLASTCLLFINSACYHIGNWGRRLTDILRRIDHANIFLLIAGTYTPFSFALPFVGRVVVISVMWGTVAVALLVNVFWISAPRWLYTATYIVIGVAGAAVMPFLWMSPEAGFVVVILTACGGLLYIGGGVVYGAKRPDPWPRVFGFHEVFHTLTVLGYTLELTAVFLVICKMR
ncbi:MAG: hemolysin III family protein [Aeriscardovia sp.]|nr:hemolysin III family protein [Aeriscardovia sp.]